MADDCVFCRIVKGEIPAEIVYEDGHAVAFLDLSPRAPGHTMVIPRVHAENIIDLPEKETGPLFEAVRRVARRLVETFEPDGLTIGINQGEISGVPHLHVHIVPRFNGDGGGAIQSVVNNPPKETVSEIAKKIKKTK